MHCCIRLECTSSIAPAHHHSRTCLGLHPHQATSETCVSSLFPPPSIPAWGIQAPRPLSSPTHKLCWVTVIPFFLARFMLLTVPLQETWDKEKSFPKPCYQLNLPSPSQAGIPYTDFLRNLGQYLRRHQELKSSPPLHPGLPTIAYTTSHCPENKSISPKLPPGQPRWLFFPQRFG